MVEVLVAIVGLVLIALIVWWFFGKHQAQAGKAVKFEMRDSTACLSHIVFEQLGLNKDLTKQPTTTVEIPTDQAGEFNFACGMDMFHGKVIVK